MKKWQIPVIIIFAVGIAVLIYFLAKQTKTKAVTRAEVLRNIYNDAVKLALPLDFAARNYSLHDNNDYLIEANKDTYFSLYRAIYKEL